MSGSFLKKSGTKYVLSSIAAIILDYIIYTVLISIKGTNAEAIYHLISTFASSFLNFNLNKYYVFQKKGGYLKDVLAYYFVCIPRTILSTVFASVGIARFSVSAPVLAVSIRLIVDAILFIVCYYIQKKWIFKIEK